MKNVCGAGLSRVEPHPTTDAMGVNPSRRGVHSDGELHIAPAHQSGMHAGIQGRHSPTTDAMGLHPSLPIVCLHGTTTTHHRHPGFFWTMDCAHRTGMHKGSSTTGSDGFTVLNLPFISASDSLAFFFSSVVHILQSLIRMHGRVENNPAVRV